MNVYSPYQVDLEELLLVKENWDIFTNKFMILPINIKDVMISATTAYYLEFLSKKFGLDQNQSSNLSRIVRDILMTDEFLGDFPMLISSKLKVDMNIANQITAEIVNKLFTPAIEDIKNIQRVKFKDRIAQARNNQQAQQPSPRAPSTAPIPRRPADLVRPDERVQEGNVVNLRNNQR